MPVCPQPAHEIKGLYMGKQRADIIRIVLEVAIDRNDQIAD